MKKSTLLIIFIVLACMSLFVGVSEVNIKDLLSGNEEALHIFLISRVPRLISVSVTGFGMSICGLIMQQLSMNPFVSPTTGATLDGAKLGILLTLILVPTASIFTQTIIAFITALGATFLFMGILGKIKVKNGMYIPLVGLMFGSLIGAFTSFLAYSFNLGQVANSWMYGKFSLIVGGDYELIYVVIPLVALAFIYAKKFTVAGMGESFAVNLGLNYKKIVNIGLVIVALVSTVIVLISGTIPFVGLIVPNLVKLYKGDHLEKNIGLTGMLGAIFLLICDLFGRIVIAPYEIPIGLTVGIVGSGLFLGLLIRRKRYEG
ncbi:MAG: ABC transporter permease [Cellulosilyticaceae bacterium]